MQYLAKKIELDSIHDLVDEKLLLKLPKYLPPYIPQTFTLRLIPLFINALYKALKYRIHRKHVIVILSSNQFYQYVAAGLDLFSKGVVVYFQTPPYWGFNSTLYKLSYLGFLSLIKLLCKLYRVVIFVFNPIDFKLLNDTFKNMLMLRYYSLLTGLF